MCCSLGSLDDTGNSVMMVCKPKGPCWCGVKEKGEDMVPVLECGHSERCWLGQVVGSEPGFPWAPNTQRGQIGVPDMSVYSFQGLTSLDHLVLYGSHDLQPPSQFSALSATLVEL